MTDIRDRHRQEAATGRRAAIVFAITLAGPLLALLAMGGFRLGWWSYGVAWNGLSLLVALPLTVIGAVAALYAIQLAIKQPKFAAVAATGAVLVSVLTLFAFARVLIGAQGASADVSTDFADPPGFPAELIALGAPAGAPAAGSCAVQAYPSQSAPGTAGYALQQADFTVASIGVGRAVGTHTGVWFGTTWDAAIRIRPGRTDIRVAAREPEQDRGEACRLATRIAQSLKP